MKTKEDKAQVKADNFFKQHRIHAVDDAMLTPEFQSSLKDKLHSLHILLNDKSNLTIMGKLKLAFLAKPLYFSLLGAVLVILFTTATIITVPSLRDKVENTSAHLFNKEESDKKNNEDEQTDPIDTEKETESETEKPDSSDDSKDESDDKKETKTTNTDDKNDDKNEVEKDDNDDKPATNPVGTISLSGAAVSNGIKFNWSVSNVNTDMGFKLVRSTSDSTPSYPGNDYTYLSDDDIRSYTLSLKDGKTYWFRICQYLGGKCGVYSNAVQVKAPSAPVLTSITLTAGEGSNVNWSVVGTPSYGFKLTWSKTAGPTYPARATDHASFYEANKRAGSIDDFDGAGTYYVRVCEYTGSGCGIYSNEVAITLE